MYRIVFFLALALPAFAQAAEKPPEPPFTVAISGNRIDEAMIRAMIEEMFRRAGVKAQEVALPVARSILELDQGGLDGNAPRNPVVEQLYSNIVRVREALRTVQMVAFSKHRNLSLRGWDDLKSRHVAYRRGAKILDINVPSAKSVTTLKNHDELFRFLSLGRADVVVVSRIVGLDVIRRLGLEDIHMAVPALHEMHDYLYLNKRHEKLAARLAEILRQMKVDGTYQGILQQHLPGVADLRSIASEPGSDREGQ